jgi:hypothetical protein
MRFEKKKIVEMLNELYIKEWALFFNYFIPSAKIVEKNRQGRRHFI